MLGNKKFWNMKVMVISTVNSALGTIIKRLVQGRLRNKRTSRDHPYNRIIMIGHNTEKSQRDLSRFTVTQTPNEKPSAKLNSLK